jgi:hypothetical protein
MPELTFSSNQGGVGVADTRDDNQNRTEWNL